MSMKKDSTHIFWWLKLDTKGDSTQIWWVISAKFSEGDQHLKKAQEWMFQSLLNAFYQYLTDILKVYLGFTACQP